MTVGFPFFTVGTGGMASPTLAVIGDITNGIPPFAVVVTGGINGSPGRVGRRTGGTTGRTGGVTGRTGGVTGKTGGATGRTGGTGAGMTGGMKPLSP